MNEIYSSTVIAQAMDSLGASGRLTTVRSNCSVTPIISEEQEKINDALIEKGEEVTYFPDTYKVSLVVDGKQGGSYARNMLDAIMQSYCTYYTEKYVEQKLSLNPSRNLLDNGYDYYECVRILENDTNDMHDFLLAKRESYPNFRSSQTGYTYKDLCAIYSELKNMRSRSCMHMFWIVTRRYGMVRSCRNLLQTALQIPRTVKRLEHSSAARSKG